MLKLPANFIADSEIIIFGQVMFLLFGLKTKWRLILHKINCLIIQLKITFCILQISEC